MKHIWKRSLILCLAAVLLFGMCGCNALDDLRAKQGILQADGTISWNGTIYKVLPEAKMLNPELDFGTNVNVTEPGVPILASVFDAMMVVTASVDRKLLAYTDSYGYTAYYCREADYDALAQRLAGDFVPDMVCFFYGVTEEGMYVTRHYALTAEQLNVLSTVLNTVEPKSAAQTGAPKSDMEIYLFNCSEDLLLLQDGPVLAKIGEQYYMEVYLETGDMLIYPIPASHNAVVGEIFKAYEAAMWKSMGLQ